jgi:hypothetical protein
MKTVARTVMGYRRRLRRRLPLNLLGMRRRRMRLGRRRYGMRRRRRVGMRRRRMRGGFIGKILSGINKVARAVPIVSTALGATGNPMAAGLARTLGYGRRRRRVRRGGFMRGFMGAIPLALNRGMRRRRRRLGRRRRVRRGGIRRRGPVSFGGYRQKSYTQFGGMRRVPRRPIIRPHIIRRSGMRRVRRGRGIMDVLKRAHDFAKEHKLISRGLSMIPHKYGKMASSVASSLGYGRRRRVRRRVGMRRRRRVGRLRAPARRHVGMRRRSRYLPNVSHF